MDKSHRNSDNKITDTQLKELLAFLRRVEPRQLVKKEVTIQVPPYPH